MDKGDEVELAASAHLDTDRGLVRWYPAGTRFTVLGYTNAGAGGLLVRGRCPKGLRVLLRPDQVNRVPSPALAGA